MSGHQKKQKLIIRIAYFCSKFMPCLEFRFWLHAVQKYGRWKWKIAVNWLFLHLQSIEFYKTASALTNFWLRWFIWGAKEDIHLSIYLNILNILQSSCFFFLLKIANSVLATLGEIILAFSHWNRNFKSYLMAFFICLTDSLMFKR